MNAILNALRHPLAERFGWSLVHLVWEGAVVAVLLAVILWFLRRRSANARYLSAVAALLLLSAGVMTQADAVVSAEDSEERAARHAKGKYDNERSSEKPAAKPVDLGTGNFKLELNSADEAESGLYAVGSYGRQIGQAPNARLLYQWRLNEKIPEGNLQLVGRLPKRIRTGAKFEVLSFQRAGSKIIARIKYVHPNRQGSFGIQSAYYRAWLPQRRDQSTLPPGKYKVRIEFVDYQIAQGGKTVPITNRKVPTIKPMTCKFVVPANVEFSTALKKLTESAIAIETKRLLARPRGESDQSPTGLNLSPLLKLTGQDKDRASFPKAHQQFRAGVGALVKAKKSWALCSLLDHPNVDARIHAARGLAQLADPNSVPVLLAAAKKNNYGVTGSENATLHSIYRSSLILALQKITGLTLVERDLKNGFHRLNGEPDLAMVDAWLRNIYLPASLRDNSKPDVPDHLRGRSHSLSMRVKDKIIEAPPELLKLARSYPSSSEKGKTARKPNRNSSSTVAPSGNLDDRTSTRSLQRLHQRPLRRSGIGQGSMTAGRGLRSSSITRPATPVLTPSPMVTAIQRPDPLTRAEKSGRTMKLTSGTERLSWQAMRRRFSILQSLGAPFGRPQPPPMAGFRMVT